MHLANKHLYIPGSVVASCALQLFLACCLLNFLLAEPGQTLVSDFIGFPEETVRWHTGKPPKLLGQGTFGRVYEAIDDDTGEIIAVKEVGRSRAPKAKSIIALQHEMNTLRLLRHQV